MQTVYAGTTGANEVAGETTSELARLIELIITKIPLWIAAFIIIIFSFVLAKIVKRIVENKLAEKGIEEEHKELQILGGRIASAGMLTLGITVGLKVAGIDLTTIIAAVAFGIGFALKDLIMNFLAGVMILAGRHFTIGDFINVGGTIGKIVEIQSRVTILQAIDGTKVIVPNAEMFRKKVTSYTSNPFRRIEVDLAVDYRSNLENIVKVCMSGAKKTKGVLLEPKPAVLIDEFVDKGVKLKVKVWITSRGGWLKIKSKLMENIKGEFDKHGIKMPWPMETAIQDKEIDRVEKMFEAEAPAVAPQVAPAQAPLKPLGEK